MFRDFIFSFFFIVKMLDDEDINLSLSPVRKSAPRQGRRALMDGGGSKDIATPPMGSPLKGR